MSDTNITINISGADISASKIAETIRKWPTKPFSITKKQCDTSTLKAFEDLENREFVSIRPYRDHYGRPDYIISGEFSLASLTAAIADKKDEMSITKEQYDKDIAQAKKDGAIELAMNMKASTEDAINFAKSKLG